MSLVRLLAAGKSLVGLRDATGRYRVTDERLLPKFGSGGNPFQNLAGLETELERGMASSPESAPSRAEAASAPMAGALPGGVDGAVEAQRAPRGGMARLAGLRRFFRAPFFSRRAAAVAGGATPVRVSRRAVQGELSLDRVQVMRNDLADADLEVVAVGARGGSGSPNPFAKPAVGTGAPAPGRTALAGFPPSPAVATGPGPRAEAEQARKRFLFGRWPGEMKRTILRRAGSSQP